MVADVSLLGTHFRDQPLSSSAPDWSGAGGARWLCGDARWFAI